MSVSINGAGSITGIDQGFNVTSGNIGIGTDNPSSDLTIAGPGASPQIELKRTNTNTTGAIGALNFTAIDDHSVANIYALGDGNDEGAHLIFKTTSAASENNPYGSGTIERLRITSDGKLLIGSDTGSIHGNRLLQVGKTDRSETYVSIVNSTSGQGGILFADTTTNDTGGYRGQIRYHHSDDSMIFKTGAAERVRIDSDGHLQIRLEDVASITGQDTRHTRYIIKQTNNQEAILGSVFAQGKANWGGDLVFASKTANGNPSSGLTERVRINSGGKVKMTSTTNNQRGLSVIAPKTQINFGTSEDVGGFLMSENNGQFGLSGGGYWDGSNWIATNSGSAQIRHDGGGAMVFCTNTSLTSGNSFTPSERFRIGNTGNITLGNQSGGAETSSAIKHIDSGRDYWNGTAGDYRALRYRTYYTNTDDAYGMGVSASLLEFQSQTNMGFFTGSAGAASGRRVERMRIDSSGRVTMPYQPCFFATSNTGGSDSSNGYTGVISNQFEHAYVNVGNHYNTSTGVFTCPVAGTYEFHGQGLVRHQTGVGRAELSFYKNGSNTISRSYGYTYITGASDHDNLHVMGYITCAANDQIDFRVYSCDSGVDVYWGQGLGYFAGRLVQ